MIDGTQGRRHGLSRWEARVLTACGAAAIAIKLLLVWHYHVDSDEPQHLHIVWAWTRGLLPYRDVFDNHAPLFHLVMAPLLGGLGERPDIVIWARMLMVPLWLLAIGFTYAIARAIDTPAGAARGAALVAALPIFMTRTTEFRTDDLWTVVWLGAVAVLVARRHTIRRTLLAGVLLGIAASVSMKTVLLLIALAAARTLLPFVGGGRSRRMTLARMFVGGLGLLAMPGLIVAYFWHRHAIAELWYGVIEHNVLADYTKFAVWRFIALLVAIAGFAAAARWMGTTDPERGRARSWLTILVGTYLGLVVIAWPARTPQTFLPVLPLIAILLTALAGRWHPRRDQPASAAGAAFVAVFALEAAIVVVHAHVWRNDAASQEQFVADTLKLTSPDDYVFDFKGETIFRRRPYYFVFESVTRRRLQLGLLRDDVADRLIETRTCVTVPITIAGLERTAAFINGHYVRTGSLLVLGTFLTPHDGVAEFDVAFPAPYLVIGRTGPVTGELDGISYTAPRWLTAGRHVFMAASGTDRSLAAIWAPAAARGFSPYSVVR